MENNEIRVKDLINALKKLPQDKPLYVASDEELNSVYKNIFIDEEDGYICLAGLSGSELE